MIRYLNLSLSAQVANSDQQEGILEEVNIIFIKKVPTVHIKENKKSGEEKHRRPTLCIIQELLISFDKMGR